MKYRYTVTCEGTVEADTPAEAQSLAMWEIDNALDSVRTIELEPLTKGEGEA